jgi:hypothetical protein
MFSLALWSTISPHNKYIVTILLQCILCQTYAKTLEPNISWKILCYIYKCTSCMTWFSFCYSVSHRGTNTKGLEVYFLSKMPHVVARFFTHFLNSDDPNPTYQTLLFESGEISHQLLHFLTVALLCDVHKNIDHICDEQVHAGNPPSPQISDECILE